MTLDTAIHYGTAWGFVVFGLLRVGTWRPGRGLPRISLVPALYETRARTITRSWRDPTIAVLHAHTLKSPPRDADPGVRQDKGVSDGRIRAQAAVGPVGVEGGGAECRGSQAARRALRRIGRGARWDERDPDRDRRKCGAVPAREGCGQRHAPHQRAVERADGVDRLGDLHDRPAREW